MKMKIQIKRIINICVCLAFFFGIFGAGKDIVYAGDPTDEILDYEVTVDVNSDATLNIKYHIEWEVLESTENGPVDWVKIGIPNTHVLDYEALSDNISTIEIDKSNGSYANVYFEYKYYAHEVISFDFEIRQDYMYQVNLDDTSDDSEKSGTATYYFTPGWFDEIDTDKLVIKWNCDKAVSWTPNCLIEDGYLTWEDELPMGEKYSVSVDYDLDAFDFDLDKEYEQSANKSFKILFWDWYDPDERVELIIFTLVVLYKLFDIGIGIAAYFSGTGFGEEKKIERTKITYYTSCPNCGGVRAEGKDVCSFCGTNMIKSKEIIREKKATGEDKKALKFKKSGTYQYGSDPNVFVRVHVTKWVRPTGNGGSGGHSSCAHSSCACACACACAGGGRAGCTSKDFMVIDPEKIRRKSRKVRM